MLIQAIHDGHSINGNDNQELSGREGLTHPKQRIKHYSNELQTKDSQSHKQQIIEEATKNVIMVLSTLLLTRPCSMYFYPLRNLNYKSVFQLQLF